MCAFKCVHAFAHVNVQSHFVRVSSRLLHTLLLVCVVFTERTSRLWEPSTGIPIRNLSFARGVRAMWAGAPPDFFAGELLVSCLEAELAPLHLYAYMHKDMACMHLHQC